MALSLNILMLFMLVYSLLKMRQVYMLMHEIRDQSRQDYAALFRQLEALQGLYAELDFKTALPPTRGWAASPDFLLELARHARDAKPQSVVECSSGVSTLVLARCMQLNGSGKVFSLEHDPKYAEQTRKLLLSHGLQDWAQVLDAPLQVQALDGDTWPWYDLRILPPEVVIDLLVIDGPPQATRKLARYPAGPLLFPRLNAGAHVFLDDASRSDELAIVQRWRKEFPALHHSERSCEKGCALLIKST